MLRKTLSLALTVSNNMVEVAPRVVVVYRAEGALRSPAACVDLLKRCADRKTYLWVSEAVYRAGSWNRHGGGACASESVEARPKTGFWRGNHSRAGPGSGRTSSTSNLTDTVLEANPGQDLSWDSSPTAF